MQRPNRSTQTLKCLINSIVTQELSHSIKEQRKLHEPISLSIYSLNVSIYRLIIASSVRCEPISVNKTTEIRACPPVLSKMKDRTGLSNAIARSS